LNDSLHRFRQTIYGRLFLSGPGVRMSHPLWLIRKVTVESALRSIRPNHRSVLLLWPDLDFESEIKQARPDLSVAALDEGSDGSRWAEVPPSDLTLVIDWRGRIELQRLTDDFRGTGDVVWLRLGPERVMPSTQLNSNIEISHYGGPGVRTSLAVWKLWSRIRQALPHSTSVTGFPTRIMKRLVALPLLFLGAALCFLFNCLMWGAEQFGPQRGRASPSKGQLAKRGAS
jgi:hypothetical protein